MASPNAPTPGRITLSAESISSLSLVKNGRVVKGVNFVDLKDAGDPVEIAKAYDKAGADELVFLDITASSDDRSTVVDMVRKVAECVFIPFTVGGGIRTVDDFKALLREGADKISINSSAINRPELIREAAEKFGSQCVVVAIDAKRRADGSGWNIYKNGGRIDMGEKHIDVIYNGCNVYRGEIRQPDSLPAKDFIFSVATVLPKKNFHVLPCLLKGTDLELVIAGNKSDYVNVILEEARKYGVEERVKIVGPIEERVKHWYLKNCKAFVFPSIAEGFGLPVLEAMAYGKPVFLSRHTCLPEIGGDYAYYFNMDFDRELMQVEFKRGLEDYYGDVSRKA